MITIDQIKEYLGEKPTPVWMCGQNICNLRDADPNDVDAESLEHFMFLIREAYDCGILIHDEGKWGLNFEFGDIGDWIHAHRRISDIIYNVTQHWYDV